MTDARHGLRAVELDFLDHAPHRFDDAEPLAAPPAAVFAAMTAELMTGARDLIGGTFHDAARGLDAQLRS